MCTHTKPSGLIAPSPVFTCRSLADSSFEDFCFWCSNLGWQECSHAVCWLQLAGGLEPIQMAVKFLCETEMAEQWIISPWRAQKLMQTVTWRRQAEEHEDIKQFLLLQAPRDLSSSKFWRSAASSLPPHLSWLISVRYRMFSTFSKICGSYSCQVTKPHHSFPEIHNSSFLSFMEWTDEAVIYDTCSVSGSFQLQPCCWINLLDTEFRMRKGSDCPFVSHLQKQNWGCISRFTELTLWPV